jgi:putative ABC transport system permease protein
VREPPSNSHFLFDGLCSMETLYQAERRIMDAWFGPFVYYTYVRLREETDARDVEHKLATLAEEHLDPEAAKRGSAVAYVLQPLGQIHLRSHLRHELAPNADATYLFVFGGVALAMLLIAAFNLVHLARERWAARLVEVDARRERVRQFVAESLLHSLLALVLAFAVVHLLFPIVGGWLTMEDVAFAEGIASMSERPQQWSYALVPWLIPAFFGLAVVIGLVAGCYPILSASPPAAGRSPAPRHVLLGAQLAVSLVLLIAGGVVLRQLVHLEDVRLGFDKAGVLVVPIVNLDLREDLPAVKAELRGVPGVIAVGSGSHVPGQRPSGGSYHPEGYPAGEAVMMDRMEVDDTFLETLGIEVVAGRGFSADRNDAGSILINQTAAREFGWRDPVGKTIRRAISDHAKMVIGVVDDFHFSSPHRRIGPIFIEARETGLPTLFVRVRPATLPTTLDALKRAWARLDPGHPFDFSMLEIAYDRQYTAERNLGKLFGTFAVLAVLITTLGFVAVAPGFGEERSAGRWGQLLTISLAANLVAWPAAYLILQRWLQTFAYRTSPSVAVFVIAAAAMLAVGFIAIAVVRVRTAD